MPASPPSFPTHTPTSLAQVPQVFYEVLYNASSGAFSVDSPYTATSAASHGNLPGQVPNASRGWTLCGAAHGAVHGLRMGLCMGLCMGLRMGLCMGGCTWGYAWGYVWGCAWEAVHGAVHGAAHGTVHGAAHGAAHGAVHGRLRMGLCMELCMGLRTVRTGRCVHIHRSSPLPREVTRQLAVKYHQSACAEADCASIYAPHPA